MMRIRKGLRDTELQRESRERDACAVVAVIEKDGLPRRSSIGRALAALQRMEHRSGFVRGEGDGCGLLLDLPRRFWHQRLAQYLPAQEARLAYSPRFAVGHLFAPRDAAGGAWEEAVRSLFRAAGFRVLWQGRGDVLSEALGPLGRAAEPLFWQVTVVDEKEVPPRGNPSQQRWQREARLFELRLRLEQQPGVHVASLSTWTVVYKALGSAATLPAYYGDLAAPSLASAACIGHNRYSTNTTPSFGRVQPFTLLGHNGEINTDRRLRQETEMLGIPVNPQGSDSQDLNRALEGLIYRLGLTPLEAMEAMFPPILDEIRQYPADWQDAYAYLRSAWGPFAQGPAAVVFRCGHTCVFSVDALGLRPLWQLETGQEYVFSSEQGVVPLAEMVAEPRPLGPGEKVAVQLPERPGEADSDSAAPSAPDGDARLLAYEDLQEEVVRRVRRRWPVQGYREDLSGPAPGREWEERVEPVPGPKAEFPPTWQLYAFGWQREDQQFVQHMAQTGAEPIRSMGCDLPLAALAPEGANLADYFKESVAVVTNPAIDREREMEHFSTWVQLGPRPSLSGTGPHGGQEARARLSLPAPVLAALPGGREVLPERAAGVAPPSPGLPPLPARWRALRPAWLSLTRPASEPLQVAVARLQQEAVALARAGSEVLVLADHRAWQCPDSGERLLGIDPHLALAAVDQALRQAPGHTGNDAADDAGDGAADHAADNAGDDAGGDAAGDAKGGRGNLRAVPAGAAAMFVTGLFNMLANIPVMTFLQENVPPERQGRVFAVLMAGAGAAQPLSMAAGGWLGDTLGVRTVFVLSGLLLMPLVAAMVAIRPLREAR
ncbi:MAG: hypothetical protein IMW99_04850 [Firmicutes bacterium]|nr:hypothetical protein [Bacillota bacterium]